MARCRRDDRGSAIVQVSILLPVMMLLLMLVVQAGLWFHVRAVMQTAANRGVDAARAEGGTAQDGTDATQQFLDHTNALKDQYVHVGHGGETVSVTVSGRVVSLIFGAPLPIKVTADAPAERIRP